MNDEETEFNTVNVKEDQETCVIFQMTFKKGIPNLFTATIKSFNAKLTWVLPCLSSRGQ